MVLIVSIMIMIAVLGTTGLAAGFLIPRLVAPILSPLVLSISSLVNLLKNVDTGVLEAKGLVLPGIGIVGRLCGVRQTVEWVV